MIQKYTRNKEALEEVFNKYKLKKPFGYKTADTKPEVQDSKESLFHRQPVRILR